MSLFFFPLISSIAHAAGTRGLSLAAVVVFPLTSAALSLASVVMFPPLSVVVLPFASVFSFASVMMFSLAPIAKLFVTSVVGVAHVIDCWKCAQGLYASLTQDTTRTELKALRESLAAAHAEVEVLQEELRRAREQVAEMEKKLRDAAGENSAPALQVQQQQQERRATQHETRPTREELQKALERMSEDATEVARGLRDMVGGMREEPAGAAKSLWDMVRNNTFQAQRQQPERQATGHEQNAHMRPIN